VDRSSHPQARRSALPVVRVVLDPGVCRYADPLSDVLGERPRAPGRLEDRRGSRAGAARPDHVAHAHGHPVARELRHLLEIEEQDTATPLIMAGSIWIVAGVVVLFVTASVYLAVRLGL
jgi:hypothetical protein